MFVLHIAFRIKESMDRDLAAAFFGPFTEAISLQEGFQSAALLRDEQSGEHVLTIAFENQPQQQRWVKSALHDEVWPLVQACLAEYSVKRYAAMQRPH